MEMTLENPLIFQEIMPRPFRCGDRDVRQSIGVLMAAQLADS